MAISHHIHRLRQQPSHVRERVAFGISGGITGVVALGWLVAMSSSGAFSLTAKTVAESVAPPAEVKQTFSEGTKGFNSLLGAAGATLTGSDPSAAVQVIETRSSSTLDASTTDATVIPF